MHVIDQRELCTLFVVFIVWCGIAFFDPAVNNKPTETMHGLLDEDSRHLRTSSNSNYSTTSLLRNPLLPNAEYKTMHRGIDIDHTR
jgi:hypothetical protein